LGFGLFCSELFFLHFPHFSVCFLSVYFVSHSLYPASPFPSFFALTLWVLLFGPPRFLSALAFFLPVSVLPRSRSALLDTSAPFQVCLCGLSGSLLPGLRFLSFLFPTDLYGRLPFHFCSLCLSGHWGFLIRLVVIVSSSPLGTGFPPADFCLSHQGV
jgi:hypothetical protein